MTDETVLVTGGAGFIGSHLCDRMLQAGYRVRSLDNLSPQVHGDSNDRPDYLDPNVELIRGDIRDQQAVRKALDGVSGVFHLASAVGVGQSMYRIHDFTSVNNLGTATLLQALIDTPVRKLVVASSMSIYGEGLYRSQDGKLYQEVTRPQEQLQEHEWEPSTPEGQPLIPVPTPETKHPQLASVYALSKYDQERMCLMIGQTYQVPTVALRFFNVYGTRQALSNPYTGVLAIFASRLLNARSPLLFEDGMQRRDFVSVLDVANALALAYECESADYQVFNIGSGQSRSIREIADLLASSLGMEHIRPVVQNRYRAGDIRHCFADISHAREVLQFEPHVDLEQGLKELTSWLETQVAVDRTVEASEELANRKLTI